MKLNPITQRCITISKDHYFKHLTKPGYYLDEAGNKLDQVQWVWINGKNIYKCIYCGLVDDLFEGGFK